MEETSPKKALGSELGRAVLHSMLGRYAVIVFQFLSLLILSRLFTPEMFGVIAAAQVLILLFQTLASAGVAPAIVFLDELTDEDRNGLYSASLLIGAVLSLVYLIVSPLVGKLLNYGADPLIALALALNVLLAAANLLPTAALQRDRRFGVIAQSDALAEIISLAACLAAWALGWGIYALVLKLAIIPVVRFLYSYQRCGKTAIGRPRPGRKLAAVARIYEFSKYQIGFNLLNFASRNADTMLVSANFGVHAVGLYNQVYRVMRYPLQLFTFALTPALHPVLTRHRDDPATVFDVFMTMCVRLAVLGAVVGAVMYWTASDLLYVLLGPQWFEAGPLLQVFAVSIGLQMVLSSTGGVFQAFGASKQMMFCGLFSSILNLTAMAVGVLAGSTIYIALFLTLAFAINFIQAFWMLMKHVFPGGSVRRVVVLSLIVGAPYLNLGFSWVRQPPPGNYVDALIGIIIPSLIGLIPLAIYAGLFERGLIRKLTRRRQ